MSGNRHDDMLAALRKAEDDRARLRNGVRMALRAAHIGRSEYFAAGGRQEDDPFRETLAVLQAVLSGQTDTGSPAEPSGPQGAVHGL